MKSIVAGCLALGVVMTASCANAADLSVAPLYKAPPPALAQNYNWTGFYLGVNGGAGWGRSFWDSNPVHVNTGGGMFGGTAGYNYQFGSIVAGVEGDIDWAHLHGNNAGAGCPLGCSVNNDWLSTARGRVGYAFGWALPYVTGGLAVGDIRANSPGFAGATETNAGWTVGGGLEVALPGNWSAKAEYLHVDLGRFNCGVNCDGMPTDNVSSRDDVFRAGVNYHFGWGR